MSIASTIYLNNICINYKKIIINHLNHYIIICLINKLATFFIFF